MSGFTLDFVFQHKYGKKWICYSDTEIDTLNKAVRRKWKTVTLPSKNPKKQIVVNFETMLQKNVISNIEQRVRCLIFNKEFHAWMWKDDDEEYSSFRPFQVYYLEYSFQQKLNAVKFYNYGDYRVDLKDFQQINEENNNIRPVVRESVKFATTTRIDVIAQQSKALTDQMCNDETLRSVCQGRIFDPSISANVSPVKSTLLDISVNLFSNEKEFQNEVNYYDFVNPSSVDTECPDSELYRVYSAGDLFYVASLSITNLESNVNKYLIMQVLVKDDKYFLWQRWGRIGYKAQTELSKFGAKLNDAKTEFEEKFYKKTQNRWQDVRTFKQVPGKYDLLQMDLSPEIVEETQSDVESLLPSQIQDLLALITSRKMMNQIMEEMAYDLKRAPLGKLTVAQIKDGYSALNKIAEVVSRGGKGKELINACDAFYTKIPHNFGRNKPPIIVSQADIEEKLKMLEALLNINIAVNILNEESIIAEHPLDKYYNSLDCSLEPMDHANADFLVIQRSLLETHGQTHTGYQMEIVEIFASNKTSKNHTFENNENKFLLWHGSRLTNWLGILKEGLRIAPPEAPSTGSMFGKGLYFADVGSKSANYCFPTKKQNIGILLLCEVHLGNALHLYHSVENMPHFLPIGYESVIGKGRFVPSDFQSSLSSCGAKIPIGPLIEDKDVISNLSYNEYVVYNTKQVKMKYLILVKFKFV